jgi:hypothetical protein
MNNKFNTLSTNLRIQRLLFDEYFNYCNQCQDLKNIPYKIKHLKVFLYFLHERFFISKQ